MPNVKEGDLARVVSGGLPKDYLNARVQVVVRTQFVPMPDQQPQWFLYVKFGLMWECELLSSSWVEVAPGILKRLEAGQLVVTPDACLRRIDPPADTEDVFKSEPLKEPAHG